MAVPLIGRLLVGVAGGLLVVTAWASVIGTLIVSRPVGGWLTPMGGPDRRLGLPFGDQRRGRLPAA
jgi:hypothetical protein